MTTHETHRDDSSNGNSTNAKYTSANGTHFHDSKMNASFEDLSFASKQVYESYLELLNYKAKKLLLSQFLTDLYTKTALGFVFLAIAFASGAAIWQFSDRMSPVVMAVIASLVFVAFAGFFLWKALSVFKNNAEASSSYIDTELQKIHSRMTQETQNFAEALSDKKEELMDQINPVEIVSQKVKSHPSLSLGAAMLAGLYTAYRVTSPKD